MTVDVVGLAAVLVVPAVALLGLLALAKLIVVGLADASTPA